MIRQSRSLSSHLFDLFNHLILAVLAVICLIPFIHVIAVSFSRSAAATANLVKLWPVGFHTEAYNLVFKSSGFQRAFFVAAARTVIGTALNLFLIVLTAYPLAREKEELRGRNAIMWFFVFTLLFSGGLIPYFLVVRSVGLMDSFWSMIIPSALPVFFVVIMMNFFRRIPKELYEAAMIDGASHWTILFRVFVPLSTASIATLAIFTSVGHWNDWFTGMIFINDANKWPLQTYLRQALIQLDYSRLTLHDLELLKKISNRAINSAQIVIAMVPIICVYPFAQRYFTKGLILGSIKE